MNGYSKDELIEAWKKAKTADKLFFIWQLSNPCPACGKFGLDFLSPEFDTPFICINCKKKFKLVEVKN